MTSAGRVATCVGALTLVLTVPPAVGSAATCRGQQATIVRGGGDHTIEGTPGADVIVAGDGNDVVRAAGGDDTVCGGRGRDRLLGEAGLDVLVGESGNDVERGGGGNDSMYGDASATGSAQAPAALTRMVADTVEPSCNLLPAPVVYLLQSHRRRPGRATPMGCQYIC